MRTKEDIIRLANERGEFCYPAPSSKCPIPHFQEDEKHLTIELIEAGLAYWDHTYERWDTGQSIFCYRLTTKGFAERTRLLNEPN